MKFAPRAREEIAEENDTRRRDAAKKWAPWPKGNYDFEIISATDTVSKSSGNEMIALDIAVYNKDGEKKELKDYLVFTQLDKLCSLCDAVGLGEKYDAGKLESYDLIGCAGKLGLGIEVEEYQGERRPKNNVRYYVPCVPGATPSSTGVRKATPAMSHEELDDAIPF